MRRQSSSATRGAEPPEGPDPAEPPTIPSHPDPDGAGEATAAAQPSPATDRSPAADPSSVPFPTRDQLVQAWGDHIVGRLRPKAKALFQAGRFVGVEGDRAVFGLPNETHRTRCAEVQEEIGSELSEHFGRPVGLVLVVDTGAGPDGGDDRPGRGGSVAPVSRSAVSPASPGPLPSGGRGDGGAGAAPTAGTVTDPSDPSDPEEDEALSAFEESELGEVAEVDNSARARVLQAFPGAEEVD